MKESSYRKLVRTSGVYDLIATFAMATPWTFAIFHEFLGKISPMPEFQPMHLLFVNLLGSIVIVWSALRVYKPEPIFGLYDAMARGLFFIWQIYYLVNYSVTPVLWGFAFFEFLFGVTQAYGYWRLKR